MVCTGVYLYYGYKLSEELIKQIFETDDFKEYCHNVYTEDRKSFLERNIHYKNEYLPFTYLFDEYLHDLQDFIGGFMKKNYRSKIKCYRLQCCAYNSNKSWIIGFKIAHLDGFDLTAINTEKFSNLEKYIPELQQIYDNFELQQIGDKEPHMYAIANDCLRCT